MEEELKIYLNKLLFNRWKFYYQLLAVFLGLYVIIIVFSDSWQEIAGIGAFIAMISIFIFVIESTRKKEGMIKVLELYTQFTPEQKNELLEQFRGASKKEWQVGFFTSPDMAIFIAGDGITAIDPSQILWTYKKISTFAPIYRYYSVLMYMAGNNKYECGIGSSPIWSGRIKDDAASDIIWKLCKYYPGIITGYSRELLHTYSKNEEALMKLYRERHEKHKQI